MRLIMLGTGPFAVPTLHALVSSPHQIELVITRPSRGRERGSSPVEQAAHVLAVEIWSPESVNLPESQERLRSIGADLLVVCDYGEILKPDTLATSRLGGINLHGSLLPKYRGAAPVQWAILRGEIETGNSVIQMTPGLDAGPCLAQQRTAIDPEEDAADLETRLATMGADAVLRVIDELAAGTARPITQDPSQASKAPRLTKAHGAIDWSQSAAEIKNLVRAVWPWPRAYTFWRRSRGPTIRLNIDRVAIESTTGEAASVAGPGTIIEANTRLIVAAGQGAIEVLELQPAGKRSMSADEFLRGNRVIRSELFGPET